MVALPWLWHYARHLQRNSVKMTVLEVRDHFAQQARPVQSDVEIGQVRYVLCYSATQRR